jgi:hypothetical protein
MRRARSWLLLPLCLAACERGNRSHTSQPIDETQPVTAEDAQLEGVPIVAVPQRPISTLTSAWGFDLDGRLVAEQFEDEQTGQMHCGIWDIESGSLVREHLYTEAEDDAYDPCVDWLDLGAPAEISDDAKRYADVGGGLTIETYGVGTRSVPGCTSCDDAVVWAPGDDQLATCNGAMLEIWDPDAGKLLRSETLGLANVVETRMGWTDQGIGVVVLHEIMAPCKELEPKGNYCEYAIEEQGTEELSGYALSSFWLPADGGPLVEDVEQYKSAHPPDVVTDVGVRWFAFAETVDLNRTGTETTVHVFGVNGRTSALGWTEAHEEGDKLSEVTELHGGFWRVDTATQWLEGVTVGYGLWGWYERAQVGWRAIVAEPHPAVFHGWFDALERDGVHGEVEMFAAAEGTAAAKWSVCNHDEYEDFDEDDEEDSDEHDDEYGPCPYGGPATGDCELLDVSPSLALALVECETGLQLVDAGRGTTVFALPHDPASEFRWGRSNHLALLEPDGKLGVVDLATGKPLYARADVAQLLEVPLAPEQDRLALRYADHLEIVTGATGERVIDVAGEWIAAALSPDGKQLAALGDRQVRIIEIASGATIASAAIDDHHGVAWRQDGAVLFYGYDWPTHAIDPKTGEELYELHHPYLDVLGIDDIDPSWRWIHRPDGSVVRTLDFDRLELGPTWARVDSGAFEGDVGDLPANLRFRVSTDPDAPAIYTAKQLEPWLRSSGLVAAFFAGKPLPSPRVPNDALAQL